MSSLRLVVIVMSLVVGIGAAQGGTDQQHVSGAWGSGERTFLELTADASGGVSGTVHYYIGTSRYPAPVGSGSFVAKTRSLRLEGTVTVAAGDARPFTIEATLDADTLRAKYAFGRDVGEVTLTRMKTSG